MLRERRAVLHPFGNDSLLAAMRWPFSKEGLLSAAACAVVLWLLAKTGGLGGLVADGLVVSFLFRVTVSTARGAEGFHGADDFRGFFQDVLGPLFRALVASVWSWGPFFAFVIWRRGGFFTPDDPLQLREISFVPVLLLFAGTLLFPMALLAGALESPLVHLLNPLVVVGYAVRLGRDYLRVSLFCLAVSLTESVLLRIFGLVDAHVLGLPDVVQITALLYPPLMMFRALGLLVRARGDELGYGGAGTYLGPVLGDARPETELLPKDRDELLREQSGRARDEGMVPGERAGGEARPHPLAGGAFAEKPAPDAARGSIAERGSFAEHDATAERDATGGFDATGERDSMEARAPAGSVTLIAPEDLSAGAAELFALARKVTEHDYGAAAALLASARGAIPASLLSAGSWIDLAKACLAGARADLAVASLRRAVAIAPDGPHAPQALLRAARILDEKLSDRAASDQLLRELVLRHPTSEEARFARRRLPGS